MSETDQSNVPEILMIAGEASSALYAQRLMEYWQQQSFEVKAFGVGDRNMEKLGFECLGRSEEMAVVGFKEVLSHYSHIKGVYEQVVTEADKRKPKVALLLDYPGFNLKLAEKLHELGIPVVYYISPQLWAWKKGRIKKVKKYIDKMLVLFPFEETFYQEHQVEVEFVGHPLLDELDPSLYDLTETKERRQRYGIADEDLLVGLMPGSRTSELEHHLQRQLEVAEALHQQNRGKKVRFALFVAPTLDMEQVKAQMRDIDLPLIVIQDDPFQMIRMADIILTASGTATIFIGLMQKPMAIMYIMNSLTAIMARFLVTSTKYFGMVNIILEKEVGKEFFQADASCENLCKELQAYIDSPELRRQKSEELGELRTRLGDRGATIRVARALEQYWRRDS